MHPSLTQVIADAHREDLLGTARRHQRQGGDAATVEEPQSRAWDVRLGWLLIRLGCRLVAQRAHPAQLELGH